MIGMLTPEQPNGTSVQGNKPNTIIILPNKQA
jgi:hypothetical protein